MKGSKMKKALLVVIVGLLAFSLYSENMVHPLDFNGSEAQKEKVILFIQENVKETYTALGMGDPATLRMMEKEELECFKKLTQAENRELLDSVIETYTAIGMVSYSTFWMMYEEELKASKETLSW